MLLNITALIKHRDYRLLYLGQFISAFGSMLTLVALPYQVYHLTGSSLAVGMIGIVQLIPLLITSLYGGALADILDRRKLLLSAEFGLSIGCLILLLNAISVRPLLTLLYLAAGINSALTGFHRPSLESLTPQLVQKEDLPQVSALTTLRMNITMIAGPAIGGILIAHFGLATIYSIDLATYLISICAIYNIQKKFERVLRVESLTRSILSGLSYAASRQELFGTYLVDIIAMIFGMPMALFPAISEQFGGATALGWLYTAPAIGALLASLSSGWTLKVRRLGRAVALAATGWGIAIIAFGFANSLFLAVLCLIAAGAADNLSTIFRITMWNLTIPTHLRGRLAGIEMISYMSGPLLGNAEAGLVAALFGTAFSVISGGVLCVIGVGGALFFLPKFWSYQAKKI